MSDNKNPNEKQPGEKEPGKFHIGDMFGRAVRRGGSAFWYVSRKV
jgi:hypothetical protein